MTVKVGDTAHFLNEKGEGIVKAFISNVRAWVEISPGVEIEVLIKELVPVPTISLKDIKVLHKETSNLQKPLTKSSKAHAKDRMIVDLHIEKLADDYWGLTNTEKLDIQINYFRRKLELAVNGHIISVVFIHGVGNGVLRQVIRDLLNSFEGIEFSDASYQKFGAGATEVRIISRNKLRATL